MLGRPGPGSLARGEVEVFTNYPESGEQFCRNTFRKLHTLQLRLQAAGSFHFYWAAAGERLGECWLSCDPSLPLPLSGLVCQTVLSKLLGPLPDWRDKLEVAYRCCYNMIHFTPIQQLGPSNSAYSLSDQLCLNPAFSPAGGPPATMEQVECQHGTALHCAGPGGGAAGEHQAGMGRALHM